MRIFTNLDILKIKKQTVCGLGNFDGVHIGHRTLIKEILNISEKQNLEPTIITFEPHPSRILLPNKNIPFLMTLEQKKRMFKKLGIKNLVLIPFTSKFSKMSYDDFIYDIIINKCRAKTIVVGYDYTFGFKGMGNAKLLKKICEEKGIDAIIIPPVLFEDNAVSSSCIRKLIVKGNIKKANKLLNRPYSIEGKVILGNRIGRKLGFPTANIAFDKNIVLPPNGVYAVIVEYKGRFLKGVANLGLKPTFNTNEINLEVHLLDFDAEIYGDSIEVFLIEPIRDEVKFNNIKDLKNQIIQDRDFAQEILRDFTVKNLLFY